MPKKLAFQYQNLDQMYRIVQGKDSEFDLIETIDREKDRYVRGEFWFILKQKSNGLIFRFVMENDYASPNSEKIIGRKAVSIRVFNKLNTFIYNQKRKIIRDILFCCKYALFVLTIFVVSGLLLILIRKVLFIRIFRFNFSDSIYFQYPFLLIFWALVWGKIKDTEKDTYIRKDSKTEAQVNS